MMVVAAPVSVASETDGLPVFTGGIGFHRLDMVAVVVPPAANLVVHVLYLSVVGFDQLPLIVCDPSVDHIGDKVQFHADPPLQTGDNRPIERFILSARQWKPRSIGQGDLGFGDLLDAGQI